MSQKCIDDESGNSEQDWEIFDILCKDVSILNKLFIEDDIF